MVGPVQAKSTSQLPALICIFSLSVGDCLHQAARESNRLEAPGTIIGPQGELEDASLNRRSKRVSVAVGAEGGALLESSKKGQVRNVVASPFPQLDESKGVSRKAVAQSSIPEIPPAPALRDTNLPSTKKAKSYKSTMVLAPDGVVQVFSTANWRFPLAMSVSVGVVLVVAVVFLSAKDAAEVERLDDKKCFFAACVLGTLNNTAYSIILSASQPIAAIFRKEDLMEAFPTLMLCACLVTTLLNGTYFIQFPLRTRIKGIAIASGVAFGTLGAATTRIDNVGFSLALVAAVVVGCCQALGELCCISFLTAFPPNALGGWGAGTGLSGVLGSASFLALTSVLGLSVSEVCYLLLPSAPLYLWSYQYLEFRLKKACPAENKGITEDEARVDSSSQSEPLSLQSFRDVWKFSGDVILYLVGNYVLQYLIYPGLIDRATLCPFGSNFMAQNAYSLGWIANSIGGTLARASIAVLQVERIWILIILQAFNVIFWSIEATSHTVIKTLGPVTGYVAILLWMIYVGALAGALYGNCMHSFGKRPNIPASLRELSTTTAFAISNVGIISSMALMGILDNGMLSMSSLFPGGCPVNTK